MFTHIDKWRLEWTCCVGDEMAQDFGPGAIELIKDYQNPDGGKEMLLQSVKELPSAAKELAYEAWQHPGDTALSIAKTVGTGVGMGAVLGYLIPGRGTCAALIGAAFTIPAAINTYNKFSSAYNAAQHSNANIDAIAHGFARDTVTEAGNFVIGTAGGLLGSEIGRGLAMSKGPIGDFGQFAQRGVLKAENKVYDSIQALGSRMFNPAAAEILAAPGNNGANAGRSGNLGDNLSAMNRASGTPDGVANTSRLDRMLQTAETAPKEEIVFGSLHGHSVYSDGMGKPAEIFAKARAQGIQFTAITDHNHTAARGGVQPGDPRYPGHQKNPTVAENPAAYAETFQAAAEASKHGDFVGLTGVEVGTIGKVGTTKKGGVNHINVLEVETFFETVREPRSGFAKVEQRVEKIFDGDYKALTTHLDGMKDSTGGRPVIQLNHPRWGADESASLPANLRGRDYGQKSYKSAAEWRDNFGKFASQIEIINGDALKPSGLIDVKHVHTDAYHGYIDKGLHLSPTFGRDFHYGDPGGTKAATGILTSGLNKPAIMDALRERRTIATTNKELLSGRMTANDKPMGSILDQARDHDLNIKMHVEGKVTAEAEYTATLWGDKKIGDKNLADVLQSKTVTGAELAKSGNVIKFDQVNHIIGAKGAFYVELERLASSGATSGAERMWTAPVWVEPLAGARHSAAVNAMLGIGSSLISK